LRESHIVTTLCVRGTRTYEPKVGRSPKKRKGAGPNGRGSIASRNDCNFPNGSTKEELYH